MKESNTALNQESQFNLKAEISKYLVHWKWLLLGLIIGGSAAYFYSRYDVSEFQSKASMMILRQGENSLLDAFPSDGKSVLALNKPNLGNQMEILKSKRLVENVVIKLGHNVAYFKVGDITSVEIYRNSPVVIQFLSPDSVVHRASENFLLTALSKEEFRLEDEAKGISEVFAMGETIEMKELRFKIVYRNSNSAQRFLQGLPINIKIVPTRSMANNYISKLKIGPEGESEDIVSLSIVQESREKAQDFLNHLMFEFNEEGVSDKKQVASKTADFVQDRLELITTELDSVEGGMEKFKQENRVMDISSGAEEFRSRSSMVEQEIFGLETQVALIKSVREMLSGQEDYELLPANLGIQEGAITELLNTYNSLILERDEFLRNSTPSHPVVQGLSARLDSLQNNLQENITSTLRAINVRLDELYQRERAAEGLFSSFPGLERGIRSIERQQQIKEQLYLYLLQKREEAVISAAATSSVAKVIDPAYSIPAPVGPNPWLILYGGLFLGLMIPVGIIFLKDYLNTKIQQKEDLQVLLKEVPFLGEIPQIEKGVSHVVQKNDRSILAESFRILRTNLSYLTTSRGGDNHKVIFVTSTIKGEGKTFVAYNLARTISASGKRVLLIGADIRNPQLHRYSDNGLRSGYRGLSEYLYNDKVALSEIINKKAEDRIELDMILSGRIPPNPAELLLNKRMGILLEEAREFYDFIIVDTAPTMLVTDTMLISPYADTTIYVTRAGYTEKGLLQYAKELHDQNKLKGMTVVVNDVDFSKFGYGAKYGYSYNYGYGLENKSFFKRAYNKFFGKN